jgi:hypothetical protein
MKYVFIAVGIIVAIITLGALLGFIGEGCSVAKDEFGPRAMLKKYEWFIDQATRLDKVQEDIAVFNEKIVQVDEQYSEETYGPKKDWPLDVRTMYNKERSRARDDAVAMVSMFNGLAREYNAQSSKFNWAPFESKPDCPARTFAELENPK